MEKPKLLLIQPNYRLVYSYAGSDTATPIYPPLGLAYIAAVVREAGFPVKIIEANANNLTHQQIKEEIANYKPDYVALTASSSLMNEVDKLANLCPENVQIILGGIHASSLPDEVLTSHPKIDLVVRREGEDTIVEILEGKPLKEIDGLSYRDKDGNNIHNKDSKFIEDLDSLPFPARDLLPMDKYFSFEARFSPIDYIVSGRGCPYRCTFCADFITSGRKLRIRSAESITKEIQYLVDNYGTQEIDFQDDNFTFHADRVFEFCDLMIKTGLNKKVVWKVANGVRCDKLTLPMLIQMKKAGCYMLSLGIESGNQEILDKMRKAEKLQDIRNAAKWCKQAGIESRGLFIFGNIGENKQTMRDTIEFAKSLPLDTATFHVCIPMPGTEHHDLIKKEGKFLDVGWEGLTAYSDGAFVHGDVNPKLMSTMQKKAYKEFYIRPSFVLKRFLRIRSLNDIKLIAKGGMEVLKFATN
jgi:anaerobic magnesium-protoporphyrin IX monomethyl ester cyclase